MLDPLRDQREDLLSFPCPFAIKAMGIAGEDFDGLVAGIIRRHAPNLGEAAVATRFSRGGKYVSVTVTILAESRAQLDAIYRDLSAHERVYMAL
ncbi:MAG: YbeD family protein [Gammaproteobacteria bacterium]